METEQRQSLPIYYPFGPQNFMQGSVRSGAAGATATMAFSLSNDPHIIRGLRIVNTYDLPDADGVTSAEVDLWQACRDIDDDQTVTFQIGNANALITDVHQRLICGSKGALWHAFAHPWPAAGGDLIRVAVTRVTAYPTAINGTPILPTVYATLWCERLVSGDAAHEGPIRGRVYGGR